MKAKIHPKYGEASITCGCGEVINTRSTSEKMNIEICSKCHPFYSGGHNKLIDTAGRIEKFRQRFNIKEGESSVKENKNIADKTVAPEKATQESAVES